MSVNLNVRRIADRLLAALRRTPSMTLALCDSQLDFDPERFEQGFLAATSPGQREQARSGFERQRGRMLIAQAELRSSLLSHGITGEDIGPALHLERAHWGMASMIGSRRGSRIVDEHEGEEIGEDVGYGPARLLAPAELEDIVTVLDKVMRPEAEARFRAQEAADHANRREGGLGIPPRLTEEEFEKLAWSPLCELKEFTRGTIEHRAWLLRWYD